MSEKPISPLRQRMIEDMSVRNVSRRRATTIFDTSRLSQPSSVARPRQQHLRIFAAFSCIRRRPACVHRLSTARLFPPGRSSAPQPGRAKRSRYS
jgi:hypothetical protein